MGYEFSFDNSTKKIKPILHYQFKMTKSFYHSKMDLSKSLSRYLVIYKNYFISLHTNVRERERDFIELSKTTLSNEYLLNNLLKNTP